MEGYRILKYPFKGSETVEVGPGPEVSITMPKGAIILTAQITREGVPSIWAIVKESREKETRSFVVLGTGNKFRANPELLEFISTVQDMGGALVWHIFEVKEPK